MATSQESRLVNEIVAKFGQGPGRRAVYCAALRGVSGLDSIRADREFPAASLVKVAILMALEHLEPGWRNGVVQRAELGRTLEPSILRLITRDREVPLDIVGCLACAVSDNLCADYLLRRILSIERLNDYLEELGCSQTKVSAGFPETSAARKANLTTARDIGRLFHEIYVNEEMAWVRGVLVNSQLNSRFPLHFRSLRIAHKTGTLLDGFAADAGLFLGENVDLILVAMTDEQPHLGLASVDLADLALDVWRAVRGRPE